MRYISQSQTERDAMCAAIGIKNVDDLFASIPEELRINRIALPSAMNEAELCKEFQKISANNHTLVEKKSFVGAGVYHHFIPAIIDYLSSRGEFLTPYTPYQPEVSQGILQAIFEYQTMVARLAGMDLANASLYDGASALAEAALMAKRIKNKSVILMNYWTHPEYIKTVKTYIENQDIELVLIGSEEKSGLEPEELANALTKYGEKLAAVAIQSPNFIGTVENLPTLIPMVKKTGTLFISSATEALSLGYLQGPGVFGADIFVGEGQSLGLYPQAGGPHIGLFATRTEYLRFMPGRVVGQTTELNEVVNGEKKRGYVLTLSTREQHIRREKATSNICTNQGLMALRVAIYLALHGKKQLFTLAEINHQRALYLRNLIQQGSYWQVLFPKAPIFNEFVVRLPNEVNAAEIIASAFFNDILPGVALSRYYSGRESDLLITVTEQNSLKDIKDFFEFIKQTV